MSKFNGKKPAGATLLATFDHEGPWSLYVTGSYGKWTNIKLVAATPQERKANYWLAWNGERLSINKDQITLAGHRPELLDALLDALCQPVFTTVHRDSRLHIERMGSVVRITGRASGFVIDAVWDGTTLTSDTDAPAAKVWLPYAQDVLIASEIL